MVESRVKTLIKSILLIPIFLVILYFLVIEAFLGTIHALLGFPITSILVLNYGFNSTVPALLLNIILGDWALIIAAVFLKEIPSDFFIYSLAFKFVTRYLPPRFYPFFLLVTFRIAFVYTFHKTETLFLQPDETARLTVVACLYAIFGYDTITYWLRFGRATIFPPKAPQGTERVHTD